MKWQRTDKYGRGFAVNLVSGIMFAIGMLITGTLIALIVSLLMHLSPTESLALIKAIVVVSVVSPVVLLIDAHLGTT